MRQLVRVLVISSLTLIAATGARAAEPGETSPFGWTGFYAGGQLGYAWGDSSWQLHGPSGDFAGAFEFVREFDGFKGTGSYFTGLQGGYNYRLPSGVVIGLEADLASPNAIKNERTVSAPALGQASISEVVELSGTVRGRLGFVRDNWLLYATAGYAWSYDQFLRMQLLGTPVGGTAGPGVVEKASVWRNGLAAGAGVEIPVASKWTMSLEYLFTGFGSQTTAFPAAAQNSDSDLNIQSILLGLNYQFGDDIKDDNSRGPFPLDSDRWSVHGQTTFVQQYAFPFTSPYKGPQSLDPHSGRETWDATLFIGWKLWPGAELWINPEIDQGFGLSGTFGVAGFPGGAAYKVGANFPYARLPRYFLRETINLAAIEPR